MNAENAKPRSKCPQRSAARSPSFFELGGMHHGAGQVDAGDAELADRQLGQLIHRLAIAFESDTALPADHPFGDIALRSRVRESRGEEHANDGSGVTLPPIRDLLVYAFILSSPQCFTSGSALYHRSDLCSPKAAITCVKASHPGGGPTDL